MNARAALGVGILLAAAALGCGEREKVWDEAVSRPVLAHGLNGGLVLFDQPAQRMLLVGAEADLSLSPQAAPLPAGFVTATPTRDGERLLLLGLGVLPQERPDDEGPSLTVIASGPPPALATRYALANPLSGLAVDPESRFAVVYPGEDDGSFVVNPNELVIVDLEREPAMDNPFPFSLRSYGGTPRGFTFTPELQLPGGPRRLLVVLTDRDVAIIDLSDLDAPEITLDLTEGVKPAGVAVTDGDPASDDDARLAIRAEAEGDVTIVSLLPVPPEKRDETPQPFRAEPNIVAADGVPSDISFVETDGGLRLAALVPYHQLMTLIDPDTSLKSGVPLGASYEHFSRITDVVGPSGEGDVGLLWSEKQSQVAFLALGSTVGKPYKAVESLELGHAVAGVLDVPAPNQHLKVLTSDGLQSFTVLDLKQRTASPIPTSAGGLSLTVSSDGQRAWVIAPGGRSLGQLSLPTLHPKNVTLRRPIQQIFDFERLDGGRALVALHAVGAVALTALDAKEPSLTNAREHYAVLLGGF